MVKCIKNIHSFLFFWIFALVPKKKNLWVFSGFKIKSFIDNTKYLYEFIIKSHPEIDAVWLTKDEDVFNNLKQNNFPVLYIKSFQGVWTMARACVAIIDHWRMVDLDTRFGFNARTKIVNLWHGSGFKNMKPENDIIKCTTFNGVRLSSDIICTKDDKFLKKMFKSFKYFFMAPFRELFEKYFLMVSPGYAFDDIIVNPWKINENSRFYCGYSKHENLFLNKDIKPSGYKILYAPTYRAEKLLEEKLVTELVSAFLKINELCENIGAEFIIKFHPHTWREYDSLLSNELSKYPKIKLDKEKDIYKNLHSYSLLITDYSSLAMEFLILDRPVIYLASDYEEYAEKECAFNIPYKENCAGEVTINWAQTVEAINYEYNNPQKYSQLRKNLLYKFFPFEYNDKNNSERIVIELKKRLNIGG